MPCNLKNILLSTLVILLIHPPLWAQVPFAIQGPGVDPSDFRLTTFATDLNYPVGMTELSDGSIMVAVSKGTNYFGSNEGEILRLVDTDADGVADERSTLYDDVPGGALSSLRMVGDLVFVTGQRKPISILRAGATPADPLSLIGEIDINYQGSWLHPHSALQVRPTPGQGNSYDLVFQLGSRFNFSTTTDTLSLSSTIGIEGDLAGDSVYMLRITDDGTTVTGTDLQQIATGLRNAAGFAWHPDTGDLYLQDNGIDGLQNPNEPTSADELNVIPAEQIGGPIDDFGFPDNYNEYRTNELIGGGDIQPLVAFQPIPSPDGAESEGPNDIAFAPSSFPASLRNGIFVGMHGKFGLGGTSNEENPLVFVNLDDNSYFHFISNEEAAIGHLDGLLPTSDSLFVADISPSGGFGGSANNTGVIYQIQSLLGIAMLGMGLDLNDDGIVNAADAPLLCNEDDPAALLADNGAYAGDFDLNGSVDFADFLILSANFGIADSHYGQGDADCSADVLFADFLILSGNFGKSISSAAAVPEPANHCWLVWITIACVAFARKR